MACAKVITSAAAERAWLLSLASKRSVGASLSLGSRVSLFIQVQGLEMQVPQGRHIESLGFKAIHQFVQRMAAGRQRAQGDQQTFEGLIRRLSVVVAGLAVKPLLGRGGVGVGERSCP